MRKAQLSMEHMFVLMLAIMVLFPGTMLFYQFSKESNHQVVSTQVDRIGSEIINNAEIVNFLGSGSRVKLTLFFPKTMTHLNVSGGEVVINYTSYAGKSEAVFFPDIIIRPGRPPSGPEPDPPDLIMEEFHYGTIMLFLENVNGEVYVWEP